MNPIKLGVAECICGELSQEENLSLGVGDKPGQHSKIWNPESDCPH